MQTRAVEGDPDARASFHRQCDVCGRAVLAHQWSAHVGGRRHARATEARRCAEAAPSLARAVELRSQTLDGLNGWLLKLGRAPAEDAVDARRALKRMYVNIFDLEESTERPLTFATEAELRRYTRATGKVFPKREAKAGGRDGLKLFLRHIW